MQKNENKSKRRQYTKVCKECGRKLPLTEFRKMKGKARTSICLECSRKKGNETRNLRKYEEAIQFYATDDAYVKIQRKYKHIDSWRILRKKDSGISRMASDEKFVKLLDYKTAWVSNYGRVIIQNEDGSYSLLAGRSIHNELFYTLDRNVYFKTKQEWGYRRQKISASALVIQTFIVNYDIVNNTKCWHLGNNQRDNYYKHLYPVTDLQYQVIHELHCSSGEVTESQILEIVNDVIYKPDGWNPAYLKRTLYKTGYLGWNDTDTKSDAYIKWVNMITRCYSKRAQQIKPHYKGKTVCDEWHNFQNFKVWYEQHMIPGCKADLDKDLVCAKSKTYSPETCSLISHFLNTVFEGRSTCVQQERDGRYSAFMMIMSKRRDIGIYDTKEEACRAYAGYKKNYIIELAEQNRGKVQDYIYDAMINWEVDVPA